MQDFDFSQPTSLPELADLLRNPEIRIIAGGTDLLPRLRRGLIEVQRMVDLSQVPELQSLQQLDDEIWIGSMLTHARLASSTLIQNVAPALAQACNLIGCRQTRYRATIGGNLANASPAADTAPILLARSARLKIQAPETSRTIPVDHFFVSPGKTCLASHEYLAAIVLPMPGRFWGEAYQKLGKRNGMAISVASVAAYLEINPDGNIDHVRVAAGSVAPTPVRCQTVEAALQGQLPTPDIIHLATAKIHEDISPISDVRASREYRLRVCQELAARAITSATQMAKARIS